MAVLASMASHLGMWQSGGGASNKEQGRKWRGVFHPVARAHDNPRVGLRWHKGPWPRRYINGFFTQTTLKLIFSKMLWICFRPNAAFKLCNGMPKSLVIVASKTCVVLCKVGHENDRICAHAILRGLYNTSWKHFLTMPIAPCSTPPPNVFGECEV